LRVLAIETSGRAIVNRNDFDKALDHRRGHQRLLHARLLLDQHGSSMRRRDRDQVGVQASVRHRTEYSMKPVR
jgi:hypothetical protein